MCPTHLAYIGYFYIIFMTNFIITYDMAYDNSFYDIFSFIRLLLTFFNKNLMKYFLNKYTLSSQLCYNEDVIYFNRSVIMSEKFQVGQIIEGTVTGIKPFGAFVSLDETTQGLVHISHITHGFLENINDAIKVGDQVKVKILSIDAEKNKISLSIKETQEKPKAPASRPANPKPTNSRPPAPKVPKKETPTESFENLMKDFMKLSNDRQADINKRLNR